MDRRERSGETTTSLLAAFEGLQSTIWTALPGIIQSWDAEKRTARILPALKIKVLQKDGTFIWVMMPELLDCPVHFAGGGGLTLTFPLKAGDECLVVFASRCIDNWWAMGSPGNKTAQEQAEFRMHDLSDGFCIAGFSSKPKVIPGISTTNAQLRTDDGSCFLEMTPDGFVTIISPTAINLTAPDVFITGAVHVIGTVDSTGDMHAVGTSAHTHVHGGVTAGGASTAPPT